MLTMTETRSEVSVNLTETGGDLALATWLGAGRPAEAAIERAYRELALALRERGFAARAGARVRRPPRSRPPWSRARAAGLRAAGQAWAAAPTFVEGSPVGREGIAGIHLLAARGEARPLAEGESVYGTVVETAEARVLGLADVGRRAARAARAPGRPRRRAPRSTPPTSSWRARASRSATWRAPGSTCATSSTGTGPFNAVRNAAFRRMGLTGPDGDGQIPASTGIEGRNARGGWCTLDVLALQPRNGRAS